jgi:hypothetical protein
MFISAQPELDQPDVHTVMAGMTTFLLTVRHSSDEWSQERPQEENFTFINSSCIEAT